MEKSLDIRVPSIEEAKAKSWNDKENIGSKVNRGLKDKTALVTGGSRGIGKAIAVAFAREGTNVVICGCGKEALKEAAVENEKLEAIGFNFCRK